MIIERKRETVHTFEGFSFMPGINVVPAEKSKLIKKCSAFKSQCSLGYMVVVDENDKFDSLGDTLKTMSIPQAKATIKKVFDVKVLNGAIEKEHRRSIIACIEDQIDMLTTIDEKGK